MRKTVSLLTLTCLFAAAPVWGDPGLIEKADRLYAENKLDDSRILLEQGLSNAGSDSDKAEIYWRLLRVALATAEAKKSRQEATEPVLKEYEKGAAFAELAVKTDNRSHLGYFWRASNWGSWARLKGGLDALGKMGSMKDDLTAALRLKPDFTSAYFVLGLLYANLPGWPISFGNQAYSVSLFRRAVATAEKPENAFSSYLNLAHLLWQRNWDAAARPKRFRDMRADFENKKEPAEKYCFFEGGLDPTAAPAYSAVPLDALSDRDEAQAVLSYLEKQVALLVPKVEDRPPYLKAIEAVRGGFN